MVLGMWLRGATVMNVFDPELFRELSAMLVKQPAVGRRNLLGTRGVLSKD